MCALQHKANLCSTNPIPAMVHQCIKWETCMNRDPTVVGRARVGAELIAEVVNGFVEPISWKTLVRAFTSSIGLTSNHPITSDICLNFPIILNGFHQHFPIAVPNPLPSYHRAIAE